MSVLIIRAHKRFAICQKARLRKPGRRGVDGLLIELSVEGCRLSNIGHDFAPDEQVSLRIDGAQPLDARVRWRNDSTIGLRFARPLSFAALEGLIRLCRGEAEPAQPLRAYGT